MLHDLETGLFVTVFNNCWEDLKDWLLSCKIQNVWLGQREAREVRFKIIVTGLPPEASGPQGLLTQVIEKDRPPNQDKGC